MIYCKDEQYLGELIDIAESCIGEERVDYEFIQGLRKASFVFMSDDRAAYTLFLFMEDGKYHMHVMSRDGGKQAANLMKDSCLHLLEERGVQVILGFVESRGERLLIGASSRLRPSVVLPSGEVLYVITKEHIKNLKR